MITQKDLIRWLEYNPDSGIFIWKKNTRKIKAGMIAGSLNNKGYIQIGFKGRTWSAATLACLYMKGHFPKNEMDHKNGVPTDNRWSNLREATRSQNQSNRKQWKRRKYNLPKGVLPSGKKYKALVWFKKKHYYLGTFDCPNKAHQAYKKKARQLFLEYYNQK